MRVDELIGSGPTLSFEFFPPQDESEARHLDTTLARLAPLSPSFVSVTYRGGPASRRPTADLVLRIQREFAIPAVAHLVCVAHTTAELREILAEYEGNGVQNLMALGGDPPADPTAAPGELRYASDLVALARRSGSFAIGVAAHPSGHPRSADLGSDRRHLADKLRAADFAVTQFFFDAAEWTTLVADLAARGVTQPVVPGVIPVVSLDAITRVTTMGGRVPAALVERLTRANAAGGPTAVREAGLAAAVELCGSLRAAGAPGLHFYTMNRFALTREIVRALA